MCLNAEQERTRVGDLKWKISKEIYCLRLNERVYKSNSEDQIPRVVCVLYALRLRRSRCVCVSVQCNRKWLGERKRKTPKECERGTFTFLFELLWLSSQTSSPSLFRALVCCYVTSNGYWIKIAPEHEEEFRFFFFPVQLELSWADRLTDLRMLICTVQSTECECVAGEKCFVGNSIIIKMRQ